MKRVSVILIMTLLSLVSKAQSESVCNIYINNIAKTDIRPYHADLILGKAKKSISPGYSVTYESDNGSFLFFKGYYGPMPKNDNIEVLHTFVILDPKISVRIDTATLRVGDPVEKLKRFFPKSYSRRDTSGFYGENIESITTGCDIIGSLGNPISSEDMIEIRYSTTTEKIIEINFRPLP